MCSIHHSNIAFLSYTSQLLGVEQEVIDSVVKGKKFNSQNCASLFKAMKGGQSTRASHQITSITEVHAMSTWRRVQKKLVKKPVIIKAIKTAIIAYVENSWEINNFARKDNSGNFKVTALDTALENMQKVRADMDISLGLKNVRVTYRMNSYGPNIYGLIPFDNKAIGAKKVGVNSVITDKAFLSTSQNRQYLTDPYDPISQTRLGKENITIKMVMLSYTGTPIGIDGIKTSNANMKKNAERSANKNISKETVAARQVRAGEGEVLFGRGTKWRVKKIDRSEIDKPAPGGYRSVYVCMEQVQTSSKTLQSSFDGSEVNMGKTSSNDFTNLYQKSKVKIPV